MATYAIGDVQGCHETLVRLLARIQFDRRKDRIWLVGDLVNRGPRSLEVLRWATDLGDRVTAVLGNHDLHLIARADGSAPRKNRDTLDDVLDAPDRDDLVGWLAGRPVLHHEDTTVLVHAGLLPQWTVPVAKGLARELEAAIADPDARRAVLSHRPESAQWDDSLRGADRLAVIRTAFTVLRTCTKEGVACLEDTGPPAQARRGCIPWFDVPGRRSADHVIAFGHWAALGLYIRPDVLALDSGCVWGERLTAVRLDDRAVFQEPAAERS